jgi:hypothetical protein
MRLVTTIFAATIASASLTVAPGLAQHPAAMPPGAPIAQSAHGAAPAQPASAAVTGKVVETMDAGPYTYVLVDAGGKQTWAAGPKTTVAVGDTVSLPAGNLMKNFKSTTLGRTFELIYFVPAIQVTTSGGGAKPAPAAAQPPPGINPTIAAIDLSNIKKAEGGYTVAELFANKDALAGKEVAVRGRVVKFNPSIMGKNWLHLRDGTGAPGTNDVTVTTAATATIGSLVLVRGKLGTDEDFGFNYKYPILIEDAAVTSE